MQGKKMHGEKMQGSICKAPKFMLVSALLLLFAAMFGVSGTAVAQSATTGAIIGTVSDAAGALVPGTVVTLISKETKATRKTKTNGSGEFRFSELEPGTFTVTFVADGFQTVQEDTVTVTVGSTTPLNPKLTVGSVSDKVEVSGDTPTLNTTGPEISTTLDQTMIDNLPINGRRWSSFALLTPGVVSNGDGFGLLSFRGISFLLNNSTVDGADNNQAYFSEERGRTRASYVISQSAVQEFQVNTSNYSAEYGRAAGGVINTVTKSGTNEYHGELFFYDRDNQWGAENPYTQLVTQVPNTNSFVATNYKPKDWRKQWGFGVGGPIIKDKLFWFYSYDQSRRNFPGTARASDPSDTFAPADIATAIPGGYTCATLATYITNNNANPVGVAPGDQYACKLASALGLGSTNFQAGAAYYTQGLGIISSFLGYTPRTSDQVVNLPKVDWQINERNRLTVLYNRLRYSAPAGVETQASNFYGRTSFGNDFVKDDFGILRFTSVLSNSLVNEFRAQYGRDFEYETSQAPTPNEAPLAANQFGFPPDTNIGYEFDLQGFDIGTPYFFPRTAYPDERRIQGEDGLTLSHGNHTVKFGVDINRVYDHTNNLFEGNGSFSYDYQWDFIADYLHATTGLGGTSYANQYYSATQGFGNGNNTISTTDWNAYLSDDWRITSRLTLTAGVRYEYEYIPPNPTINNGNSFIFNGLPNVTATGKTAATKSVADTALPLSASRPDDRNNWGPRVGFAWNIFGDNKTTLRGGYGLFYGRVINSNIALAYSNSGGPNGQIAVGTRGSSSNLAYPNIFPSSMAGAQQAFLASSLTSTVAFLDPHMQNPQVHEFDVALQQDLGWKAVFSLTYMGSLGRELPSVYDTNAPTLLPGAAGYSTFTVRNDLSVTPGGGVTGSVLPRGGHLPPLAQGSTHVYKQYTGPRPNPYYYAIYRVSSRVNSSYNALSAQLNKHFSNSFSLLSNFTWAKAMDYNPYLSTSYGSSTYLPIDPNDQRQDYGLSSLNVGKRFVLAAHWNPHYNRQDWTKWAFDGWGVSPQVQAQTGLPYSATTSGTQTSSTLSGPLGSGGAARLPKYDFYGNLETERNIFNYPKTAVVDLRVSKNFNFNALGERVRLEMFAEAFNLMNHQNITSVSTGSYTICTKVGTAGVAGGCPSTTYPAGTGLLIYNSNFGTYKNSNSNTIYSPRELQIAARLHF